MLVDDLLALAGLIVIGSGANLQRAPLFFVIICEDLLTLHICRLLHLHVLHDNPGLLWHPASSSISLSGGSSISLSDASSISYFVTSSSCSGTAAYSNSREFEGRPATMRAAWISGVSIL